LTAGCDPGLFTEVVVNYLSVARALKHEIELHSGRVAASGEHDRRTEPRFSRHKVPWIR
jgi:hypothetical protein